MSFKDFFEGHSVKTTIAEIKNLIPAIIEKYPDTKNLDELIKLDNSLQYITNIINNTNYYISPRNRFDSINQHLQNVKNYLVQYQASRSSQLTNAIPSIEEAVILAQQIVPNNSSQKYTVNISPKEIIEKLAKTSEITIAELQNKTTEFNQKSDEYVSKLKTAENNYNAVQQRIDTYLSSLQTNYNTEEKSRKDTSDKNIKQFELEIKTLINKIEETNKNNETDIQKKAEVLLNELERIKQKAGEILQIVSNTGFAGNYSKNADSEKKNANILRGISIGIFIVVSGLALYILFTFQSTGLSWQSTLVRLLATSLPSALATYLARESGKHRKLERIYRNMELELSALDVFIENIPEKERTNLKIEITRKLFSDDRFISEIDSKNEVDNKAVFSMPENFAQAIAELIKSLGKK
jgi:hypothetical protein